MLTLLHSEYAFNLQGGMDFKITSHNITFVLVIGQGFNVQIIHVHICRYLKKRHTYLAFFFKVQCKIMELKVELGNYRSNVSETIFSRHKLRIIIIIF